MLVFSYSSSLHFKFKNVNPAYINHIFIIGVSHNSIVISTLSAKKVGINTGSFFGNKVSIGYYEVEGESSVDGTGALTLGLQVFSILQFDASIEEEHKASVDITDHPVEDGSTMSDHRLQKPREFTLTAIVTNTPPTLGAFFRYDNVATRDVDTWTLLNTLTKHKSLLTVKTTLDTYENMVIKDMSVPRTAALGNSLEVTITFREIFTEAVRCRFPSRRRRRRCTPASRRLAAG